MRAEHSSGNQKKPGKKLQAKDLGFFLIYIGAAALAVLLLIAFVVQRADVYGRSMELVLQHRDVLLVDKLSYRFSEPARYDIVVFEYRLREGRYYTKRIIGLPGETVQIKDGWVYINGQKLEDDVGAEPIAEARQAAEPITLGEDEYFVLGDNRNFSSDSRDPDVGNIRRDEIIGKIWIRLWPLGKMKVE